MTRICSSVGEPLSLFSAQGAREALQARVDQLEQQQKEALQARVGESEQQQREDLQARVDQSEQRSEDLQSQV